MRTVLRNATILHLDSPRVESGHVWIDEGRIIETPNEDDVYGYDPVDCTGRIVMPGLVIGHTHLYSALAPGMPPPRKQPRSFVEILEQVWWKLDRALDDEAVHMSALVGAARAAMCGVTCVIDHHASPNAITGSLDRIREALEIIGMRGVLCYEVTDRNGPEGARAGLEENARYMATTQTGGMYAGLVGAHASFTLGDESMQMLAEIADQFEVGVHIHVAEDPADVEDCRLRTNAGLIDRLEKFRILREGSLLAHCTHLEPSEIARIRNAGAWTAHNTRSNMNNAVGYAPIEDMARGRIALGTDGIDGDLFAESKTAWFKARDARTDLPFGAPLQWMNGAAQLAGSCLKVQLGKVAPGAAADLVILNYDQRTPLRSDNVLGHWFFGLNASHVESVMCRGKWIIRNRELTNLQAAQALAHAPAVAQRVWTGFQEL